MHRSSSSSITFHVQEDSNSSRSNHELSPTHKAIEATSDNNSDIIAPSRHTESLVSLSRPRFSSAPLPPAPQTLTRSAETLRDYDGPQFRRTIDTSTAPQEVLMSVSALTMSEHPMVYAHSSMECPTSPSSSPLHRKMSRNVPVEKLITPTHMKVQETSKAEEEFKMHTPANVNTGASVYPGVQFSSAVEVQKEENKKTQKLQKQMAKDEERLVERGGCSNMFQGFQRLFRLRKGKKKRERDAKQATTFTPAESTQKLDSEKEQKTSEVHGGPLHCSETCTDVGETSRACIDPAENRIVIHCDLASKNAAELLRSASSTGGNDWAKTSGDTWSGDEAADAHLNSGEENDCVRREETYNEREELDEVDKDLDAEEKEDCYVDDDGDEEEAEEGKKEKLDWGEHDKLDGGDIPLSSADLLNEKETIKRKTVNNDSVTGLPSREETSIVSGHAKQNARNSLSDVDMKFEAGDKEGAESVSVKIRLTQSQSHDSLCSTVLAKKGETGGMEFKFKDHEDHEACENPASKDSGSVVDIPAAHFLRQGSQSFMPPTKHSDRHAKKIPVASLHRSTGRTGVNSARAFCPESSRFGSNGRRCRGGGSVSPPPRAPMQMIEKRKVFVSRNGRRMVKWQRTFPQISPRNPYHRQQRQPSASCNTKKQRSSTARQKRGAGASRSSSTRFYRGRKTSKERMIPLTSANAVPNYAQTPTARFRGEKKKNPPPRRPAHSPTSILPADKRTFTPSAPADRCSGNSYARLAEKRRDHAQQSATSASVSASVPLRVSAASFARADSPLRIAGLSPTTAAARPLSDGLSWHNFKAQFYAHSGGSFASPTAQQQLSETDEEMLALLLAHTRASCAACRSSRRELRLWQGIEHLMKKTRRVREEFYETPPPWWKSGDAIDASAQEGWTSSMRTGKGEKDISGNEEKDTWAFGYSDAEEKQHVGQNRERLYSNASAHLDDGEQCTHSFYLECKTNEGDEDSDSNGKAQKHEEGQVDSNHTGYNDGTVPCSAHRGLTYTAVDEQEHVGSSVTDEERTQKNQRGGREDKVYADHNNAGPCGEMRHFHHESSHTHMSNGKDFCHDTSDLSMASSPKMPRSFSHRISAPRRSAREGTAEVMSDSLPRTLSERDAMRARPRKRETGDGAVWVEGKTKEVFADDRSSRAEQSWEEERRQMEQQLITLAAEKKLLEEQLGIYAMFEEAKRHSKEGGSNHAR